MARAGGGRSGGGGSRGGGSFGGSRGSSGGSFRSSSGSSRSSSSGFSGGSFGGSKAPRSKSTGGLSGSAGSSGASRGGASPGTGRSMGGGGSRSFGGRTGGSSHNRAGAGGGSVPAGSRPPAGGGYRPPPPIHHRPYYHRPRPIFLFGPRRRRYYMGGPAPVYGGGGRGMGCATTVLILVCAVLLVELLFFFALPSTGGGGQTSITQSTIKREPLPKGAAVETGYYTDDLGWVRNPTTLTAGMKNFYQKTGVQPYLYLTDEIGGSHNPTNGQVEEFIFDLYDYLFEDEAHLLLIFMEYDGVYNTWYLCGSQAKTVIDDEAADILLDYVDRYYYTQNLTDDEMFSKAFDQAATRIMEVTTPAWIPVAVVGGTIVLAAIAFLWWSKAKKQKNLEAEQTKEILDTPLETFGESGLGDLEKKYQDSDE